MTSTRLARTDPKWGRLVFDAVLDGPDDGELVVLLHGFPETSHEWRHQVPALAAAGYRVLAPDQRGYSPDARPTAVEAYGNAELTADVLALADRLGADRFHLVGHDWGGAVAWQVAGRHPDRLLTLTVLSTPHPAAFGAGLRGDLGGDQTERSSYMDLFKAEGSEHQILADDAAYFTLMFAASGLTEADAAYYRGVLGTPEALGAALNWYRAADLTLIDGLGPILAPTMYVWSTDDLALGREPAEATASLVEGPYRFEVLEDIGHWIPELAPEATTRLLLEHLSTLRRP